MKLDPFLAERREDWRRLSSLLERLIKIGPGRLTVPEIEELGRLYRRAASDLAYATGHFDDPETLSYLNQLVARGHAALYLPRRARWNRLWRFWTADFPRQVRATLVFCLIAGFLLFGSATVGGVVASISPESASLLLPERFAELLQDPSLGQHTPDDLPAGLEALLGSLILTNNIKVGFISFALGIAFGAGTVYVLLQNGLILGALGGVLGRGKTALMFWSLIAPHGGMELLAVCLCGGSGLLLGWSLISPGDYVRTEALVVAGRRAIPLVLGTVPIFGMAALVEAFVTPAPAPAWLKLAIGAVGASAVLFYLGAAGRHAEASEAG